MKSLTPLFLIALCLSTLSCKKDAVTSSSSEDFLIFGTFYGFCHGDECNHTYKLTGDKLYEDVSHSNPFRSTFFNGQFKEMNNEDYNDVKNIQDQFPSELLQEKDTILGCPDCADQGGIYIEYKSGKTHRYWVLDNIKSGVPTYLHPFMDEIRSKIELMKE